ncbi:hypothetical protein K491DRAFT_298567 [Lophiostoma macrostomum CBS 122681]|uniref:Nephrocystin 3-like N-terminal domain-containing protein n=1 Tax=Lophiostoma macrostomum CBS 122681 TaxID=1314788 RepID=A0A6A6SLR3_9PLEO|nr:hypothetical protein K491DRAFT_298567 [Lophiostoma macrostomum CBS 122681]
MACRRNSEGAQTQPDLLLYTFSLPHSTSAFRVTKRKMEALAGLSVAANLMQVIAFSRDTVALCKTLRQTGSIDPALAERTVKIRSLVEDLETKISQSTALLSQSQNAAVTTELPKFCKDVVSTAKDLEARLHPFISQKRRKLGTAKVAIRNFINKSETDRLERTLLQLEQTLQTQLLTGIWSKQDAIFIQQHQSFEGLEKELKDFIQKDAQERTGLEDDMRRHSEVMAKIPIDLIESFANKIHETKEHITQVVLSSVERQQIQRQNDQLRRSFLFNPRNARKTAVRKAHEETFQWVFEAPDDDIHSTFRKWILADDNPLFWVQGKPGSGKSTLMKFLAFDDRTSELIRSKHLSHAILVHFTWMADKKVDGTLRGLLCSLIYQILEADTDGHLTARFVRDLPKYRRRISPIEWEMEELEHILETLVKLYKGLVVMFVDGLDELDVSEDKMQLNQSLLEVALRVKNLKLCVSSRPEPEFQLLLRKYPTIRLQDLTENDMRIEAESELPKYFAFAMRTISSWELHDLISLIVEKAQGVFLWIILALI